LNETRTVEIHRRRDDERVGRSPFMGAKNPVTSGATVERISPRGVAEARHCWPICSARAAQLGRCSLILAAAAEGTIGHPEKATDTAPRPDFNPALTIYALVLRKAEHVAAAL